MMQPPPRVASRNLERSRDVLKNVFSGARHCMCAGTFHVPGQKFEGLTRGNAPALYMVRAFFYSSFLVASWMTVRYHSMSVDGGSPWFYAPTKSSRETKLETPERENICVALCVFGVIARSIKETWPTVIDLVISPLSRHADPYIGPVEVHAFNVNPGDAKIDGVTVSQDDLRLIEYDSLRDFNQTLIDIEVSRRCVGFRCELRYDGEGLAYLTRNAFRQLYVEWQVSEFLSVNSGKFDVAIATGSDFLFVKEISTLDVLSAARNSDVVFTTNMNDAGGFTNGFYIGHPETLSKVLRRYSEFHEFPGSDSYFQADYEKVLKDAFEYNNVSRKVTDMPFCKVRANNFVWVPPGFKHPTPCLVNEEI